MRSGCIAVLTGLLAFHAGLVCAESSLDTHLDACIRRHGELPPSTQMDLAKDCPELSQVLEAGTPSQIWPPLKNLAPFEQLIDVQRGLAARREPLVQKVSLDPSRLDALLSDIAVPVAPPPPSGLWERFLNWLEEKLAGMGRGEDTWLDRFIRDIDLPPWVYRFTMMGMGLVIIALAVMIVVGEFRGVTWRNLLRRRRDISESRTDGPDAAARGVSLTLQAIAGMDLRRQPSALFRYVLRFLVDRQVLSDTPSRTNRELALGIKNQSPGACGLFRELAEGADLALYGDRVLTEHEVAELRDKVSELKRLFGNEDA